MGYCCRCDTNLYRWLVAKFSWRDGNVRASLHAEMTSAGRGVSAAGRTVIPSSSSTSQVAVKQCAGCGTDILDRYLLNAIDVYWHMGCLRCAVCQAALADIGSTCFTRAGLILCKPDYIRWVHSGPYLRWGGLRVQTPSEIITKKFWFVLQSVFFTYKFSSRSM